MTKYGAKRTWSNLCQRTFDSKAECLRGEELRMLEMAGGINTLQYQVKFILSKKPLVTIKIDFAYQENMQGKQIYEDVKGMGETREFRVKRIWLQAQQGIEVKLT